MTPTQSDGQTEPDIEAGKQQDAMKDQLRKDVASWSASRAAEAPDLGTRAAATKQSNSPPAARPARQKAKAVVAATPVPAEKKPFKMSYDGTTDRDYIAQRIKLGAR